MLNSIIVQVEQDNLAEKIEVLVSDNCSDDGTEEFMLSLKKPYITYSRNEKNLGFTKNILKLAGLAKGKYWMFYGDDDVVCHGSLIKMISLFEENPEMALVIFSQKNYMKVKDDKKVTIHEAVRDYYYYLGNKCSAAKTEYIKEHFEKYFNQIATTCWPQTHLMLLAAFSSGLEKPVLTSTLAVSDFQIPDDNNVKNAFYYYEAGMFSLVRLAYLISEETGDKEFTKQALLNRKNLQPYSFVFYCLDNTFSYHFIDLPNEQEDYRAIIKESKIGLKGNHKIYAYVSDFVRIIPKFIFKIVYLVLNAFRMSKRGVGIKENIKNDIHTIKNGRAEKVLKKKKKHAITLQKGEW